MPDAAEPSKARKPRVFDWRARIPPEIADARDRIEPAIWLGRRYERYKRLTTHPLFPQIYGQLVSRVACRRIAQFVAANVDRNDPLGPGSIKEEALERSLTRFRSLLPPHVFLPPSVIDDKYKRLWANLDVVEEFDALIRMQKNRLEKFMELEQKLPLNQLRMEVETLGSLLSQRNSAALALSVGQPGAMIQQTFLGGQHLTVGSGSPADAVRQFVRSDPNKTGKLLELMDQIDQADGVIDMEPNAQAPASEG